MILHVSRICSHHPLILALLCGVGLWWCYQVAVKATNPVTDVSLQLFAIKIITCLFHNSLFYVPQKSLCGTKLQFFNFSIFQSFICIGIININTFTYSSVSSTSLGKMYAALSESLKWNSTNSLLRFCNIVSNRLPSKAIFTFSPS